MVSRLCSLNYEERLQKLGLWSLEERGNRADLIGVFKMAHGFSAIRYWIGLCSRLIQQEELVDIHRNWLKVSM